MQHYKLYVLYDISQSFLTFPVAMVFDHTSEVCLDVKANPKMPRVRARLFRRAMTLFSKVGLLNSRWRKYIKCYKKNFANICVERQATSIKGLKHLPKSINLSCGEGV